MANKILAGLSLQDLAGGLGDLELVSLAEGDLLFESDSNPPDYLYFPVSCIVSLRSSIDKTQSADFVIVGNEGVVGAFIFFGNGSGVYSAKVECSGLAYRIPTELLVAEFKCPSRFRILMLSYMQALVASSLQVAICDAAHSLLARVSWVLLSCDDRLLGQKAFYSNELLAKIVDAEVDDVRNALAILFDEKIVEVGPAGAGIVNRIELEARSCKCYLALRGEFDRLLPVSGA